MRSNVATKKPDAPLQHGLLGVVLGVKQGKIKIADVRLGIRGKVERMAGEMSAEQVAEYSDSKPASTPAKFGIPAKTRAVRE